MAYSAGYEQELRRQIRDERALDPLITNATLTKKLSDRHNHSFDPRYIGRLAGKVAREGLIEVDRTRIEERIALTRENYRMMREELLKIVYWKPEDPAPKPLARDKVEAAKSVVMMDLALLQAEIGAGIYKKPIEALAKEFQYEPLPDDVRMVVIAAWQRGGMLPAATVEATVPGN